MDITTRLLDDSGRVQDDPLPHHAARWRWHRENVLIYAMADHVDHVERKKLAAMMEAHELAASILAAAMGRTP